MPSLFNIKRNDKNSKANIQIFVVPSLYFFMAKSTGKKSPRQISTVVLKVPAIFFFAISYTLDFYNAQCIIYIKTII